MFEATSSRFEPSSWLEQELARQLRPVLAPAMASPTIAARKRPSVTLPVTALAVVIVLGGLGWRMRGDSNMDTLARQELRSLAEGTPRVDFASADPIAIRNWVRAGTGAELELRGGGARTRLIGARIIRTGKTPVAVVLYRTGNDRASLLVARTGGSGLGVAGHVISTRASGGARADNQSFSWRARDQVYALAVAGTGNPHEACALCHEAGVL